MKNLSILSAFLFIPYLLHGQQTAAKDIVRKAYELMQGVTNESVLKMTIARPAWQRTIEIHIWSKGHNFSLALITQPAKEKGQAFLKRNNEIWNWIPSIQRMVKLPPSMLSQGWMGSDFSNDELLKESSVVDDFDHTLLGIETVSGTACYKIKLVPKPDVAIVWGSIVKWISKDGYFQMKTEYFDEDNVLVKTETASDIKTMGNRLMPTHFELEPADNPGNKTILIIEKAVFDFPLDDSFFSQQNMKNVQ